MAANGSRGTVVSTSPLRVQFETGATLPIGRYTWEFFGYDQNEGRIVKKGTFKQVPLLLGWAITAHKSQGMSLSEIEIDVRKMFDTGQSYVALSRVFSVSGLTLRHYLMPHHFMVNQQASEFMRSFTNAAYWVRQNRHWNGHPLP